MSQYYLGIDTGATKSQAIITDGLGHILGFGEGGPGNWETVGWPGTQDTLEKIITQAASAAGINRRQISAAGFGLAGYDWPEDHPPHEAIIQPLGLDAPYALANDAFIGFLAGTTRGWGLAVSAGTSCNCYGRDPQGRLGRMAGSSFLGEFAGGGELVRCALQAISRAWSRRGPPTALTGLFIAAAGAADVEDLLAGIMRGRYTFTAGQAPLVFAAAADGDRVALETLDWAAGELADLAIGVMRQLSLEESNPEIILAGGFYKGSPRIAQKITEIIRRVTPRAQLKWLESPPVSGAVILAMEQLPTWSWQHPQSAEIRRILALESRSLIV